MESLVAGIWEPLQKLGEGAQGEVFLAKRSDSPTQLTLLSSPHSAAFKFDTLLPSDTYVAIKREPSTCMQLQKEMHMYSKLRGVKNIPRVFWFGETSDGNYNVIVMEILGPDLKKIRQGSRRGVLNCNEVAKIGLQLIDILQSIHTKGYVYVDVKPENFLASFGHPESDPFPTLHIVDLANATHFKLNTRSQSAHRSRSTDSGKTRKMGTAKYVSINLHFRKKPQPRDDIESLSYVLLELLSGQLPWSNAQNDWNRIRKMKQAYDVSSHYSALDKFIDYARNLGDFDLPDYTLIKSMLQELSQKRETKFGDDGIGHTYYHWQDVKRTRSSARSASRKPREYNKYHHKNEIRAQSVHRNHYTTNNSVVVPAGWDTGMNNQKTEWEQGVSADPWSKPTYDPANSPNRVPEVWNSPNRSNVVGWGNQENAWTPKPVDLNMNGWDQNSTPNRPDRWNTSINADQKFGWDQKNNLLPRPNGWEIPHLPPAAEIKTGWDVKAQNTVGDKWNEPNLPFIEEAREDEKKLGKKVDEWLKNTVEASADVANEVPADSASDVDWNDDISSVAWGESHSNAGHGRYVVNNVPGGWEWPEGDPRRDDKDPQFSGVGWDK